MKHGEWLMLGNRAGVVVETKQDSDPVRRISDFVLMNPGPAKWNLYWIAYADSEFPRLVSTGVSLGPKEIDKWLKEFAIHLEADFDRDCAIAWYTKDMETTEAIRLSVGKI